MLENERLAMRGKAAQLVPYTKRHVLKCDFLADCSAARAKISPPNLRRYHGWMQSEQLLEQTASEPLSLDQEYEMQRSWRTDQDKCTFIVLATHLREGHEPSDTEKSDQGEERLDGDKVSPAVESQANAVVIADGSEAHAAIDTETEEAMMVGDVNLFLNDPHDPSAAEIDVMIAEAAARGRGIGREAVLLMLHYGTTRCVCKSVLFYFSACNLCITVTLSSHAPSKPSLHARRRLKLSRFVAKIGLENVASLGLFTKLGFVKVSECKDFNEATLEMKVGPGSNEIQAWWADLGISYDAYTLPNE